MKYLILTEQQANQIRGKHGLYSEIEPIKTPDGNYIISEICIDDKDLISIKNDLLNMSDDKQEIIDLPTVGGLCEKDHLYKYSEGTEDGYNGLVKCVQTHTRTIYKPEETPALFSFFRENLDTLEWIPNEWVKLGWKRIYKSKQYEVIQAHQTLSSWTPDVTPDLWKEVIVAVDIPVWVQPTGSHDAYRLKDKVIYNGKIWECISDYCVYAPGVFGWKEVTA